MSSPVEIDATVSASLATLKQKLGNDGEALALVAIFAASWHQLALLYSNSEDRHAGNAQGAAALLTSIGASMTALRTSVAAGDAELAKLHDDITAKIDAARASTTKAKTEMKDILDTYAAFAGETAKLKKGIGSLAKSAVTALNPALSGIVSPWIDKLTV